MYIVTIVIVLFLRYEYPLVKPNQAFFDLFSTLILTSKRAVGILTLDLDYKRSRRRLRFFRSQIEMVACIYDGLYITSLSCTARHTPICWFLWL